MHLLSKHHVDSIATNTVKMQHYADDMLSGHLGFELQ